MIVVVLLVLAASLLVTVLAIVVLLQRREITVTASEQLSELRAAVADLTAAARKANASADRIEAASKKEHP